MYWIKPLLAVSAAVLLLSANMSAAELKEPKLMASVTPVPSALLINAYRFMGKLKHFSIDAVTTSDDIWLDKMVVTYTHHVHMDLNRPGQLHISTSGDIKERDYYLNNGYFTVYDDLTRYYGMLEVPKNIDKALDYLFERYDVKTALANVLYSDLDRRIPPKDKGYYFGVSNVDDIPCHHIGFVGMAHEMQVWIEKGKYPLIRKFIIIDKTKSLMPRSGTVLRWRLDPKFDKSTFSFDKPSNAIEIDIKFPAKEEAAS